MSSGDRAQGAEDGHRRRGQDVAHRPAAQHGVEAPAVELGPRPVDDRAQRDGDEHGRHEQADARAACRRTTPATVRGCCPRARAEPGSTTMHCAGEPPTRLVPGRRPTPGGAERERPDEQGRRHRQHHGASRAAGSPRGCASRPRPSGGCRAPASRSARRRWCRAGHPLRARSAPAPWHGRARRPARPSATSRTAANHSEHQPEHPTAPGVPGDLHDPAGAR